MNVTNLDPCYTDSYSFSLPKEVLESYYEGIAFDRKERYSDDEKRRLCIDINNLYQEVIRFQPTDRAHAVITAGAPGAGKTTLLEQIIEKRDEQLPYLDPDAVSLKSGMPLTYERDLNEGMGSEEAYTKWRPGSNASCSTLLAHLIRDRVGFYFGTTCTGAQSWRLLDLLKQRGYTIELIHLTTPDAIRIQSHQQRSTTFVQATESDLIEKGKLLPQRIQDTYLKYADSINFYYRGDVDANAELAAVWVRGDGETPTQMHIEQPNLLEQIKSIHNTACLSLGKEELVWEKTVEPTLN